MQDPAWGVAGRAPGGERTGKHARRAAVRCSFCRQAEARRWAGLRELQCDSGVSLCVIRRSGGCAREGALGRGCPRSTERKSALHLEAFAARGTFSSFRSLKINIQRSLVHDGTSGAARSSRLPSLSMTEITLASRGVTAPWTRFQRVCLQQETGGPSPGSERPQREATRRPPVRAHPCWFGTLDLAAVNSRTLRSQRGGCVINYSPS